jgi:hypothetical protein
MTKLHYNKNSDKIKHQYVKHGKPWNLYLQIFTDIIQSNQIKSYLVIS